jgi:hypothetical protein
VSFLGFEKIFAEGGLQLCNSTKELATSFFCKFKAENKMVTHVKHLKNP